MSAQQFKAEIETIINKVREGFTNRSVFATDEQFNEAVYVAAAEKSGFIAKFVAGEYVVFTKENAKKFNDLRNDGERPKVADFSVKLIEIINC